jgi:hypothetical protein
MMRVIDLIGPFRPNPLREVVQFWNLKASITAGKFRVGK